MSTPPGAMSFWSLYASRTERVGEFAGIPIHVDPYCPPGMMYMMSSAHGAAEIAALAAMTPDERAAFVARFNADTAVWQAMRENVAQRAAQPAVAPSDQGIDGFIPLPEMTDPTLGGAPFVSDAEWADQNRRANEILSGRNAPPRGE